MPAAFVAALVLAGCAAGDERREVRDVTDEELREAAVACGFRRVQINPPGDPVRMRFDRNEPGYYTKEGCFVRRMEELGRTTNAPT